MHPYMPLSPCGPHCLDGDEPTVGRARVVLRLAAAVGVVLGAFLVLPFLALIGRRGRELAAKLIFRGLLGAFGVRLTVTGDLPRSDGRGVLVVTNHISWLDVAALNAVRPMRAMAKTDLRSWPVLGTLIARAGTVFLDRESLRALPGAVDELARVLCDGSMIYVCPEGTTWCGKGMGRFRPALFQSALDAGVPVRPVAVRYHLASGRETPAPAFIGTETILESMMRVARLRGLHVELRVCAEIAPGRADDRRSLAALTEAAMNTALGLRVTIPAPRTVWTSSAVESARLAGDHHSG
ncbi:1-acyl-sn-glycerol-3-phosphate acyltransferase [Actinokineospora sp. UTMC 2448]|uniref:lysophospholipid acyltransferase family protein n=1 Tax=Actinokineospora sp. UTMC 2448 TaxID=2268449 RepID=UPI002164045D|nr:lysophospholipid acyltransferase family protein [Actinokineospora sp. UTMC 2448]UVS81270.1 1-acyl-sn-glycerol-3-phosphate acyltransferase [Actinokineospora sp. UTMC 2448]